MRAEKVAAPKIGVSDAAFRAEASTDRISRVNPRAFLRNAAIQTTSAWVTQLYTNPLAGAASTLKRFRVAVISDGLSQDLEAALQIMNSYGISWSEIRRAWGKYNTEATPEQIRRLKPKQPNGPFKGC